MARPLILAYGAASCRVSGDPGCGRRHRAVRSRGERNPRRLRHRARCREAAVLPSTPAPEPLTFPRPVRTRPEYFLEHPFDGGPRRRPATGMAIPRCDVDRAAVIDLERAHTLAERALALPALGSDPKVRPRPGSGPACGWISSPLPGPLQRVRAVELHFVDDNTLALTRSWIPTISPRSRSTHLCSTGRSISRTCTVPRSLRPSGGWIRSGGSVAIDPTR